MEDRRMLAKPADIVFLVDKSASGGAEFTWVADIVDRVNGLDDYLRNPARDIDARYGLVGFGDGNDSNAVALGHSHELDPSDSNGDSDKLFGTAAQLADVVADVTNPGSDEFVYDGIEHAIAEYEFRPGAAVIFVMFRRNDDSDEGPNPFAGNLPINPAARIQTFTGTLAALDSYNVTLNTVVEAFFDPEMFASTGGMVLGVEAERIDRAVDGHHVAHVVNPVANQPTLSDLLAVSLSGSNSVEYVDTGKSILINTSATPEIVGPGTGGYRATDVTYAFEDISTTGTLITSWDAGTTTSFKQLTSTNLSGYSFNFYGANYNSLYVNADGTITFDGASDVFPTLWTQQNQPGPARIAPLWADFDALEPFDVYWQIKNLGQSNERLVIQWDGFNYSLDAGAGATETVTFQAVLYENGDIVFNYQDLDVTEEEFAAGRMAAVGIADGEFLHSVTLPAGVFVDGIHDFNARVGVEDDFIRLAWETGGAAWNNNRVATGSASPHAAAFDAAFIESIADQIIDKHARGDVVFAEGPVIEINIGGLAVGSYIADTNSILGSSFLPTGTTPLSTTQTIVRNGNSMAGDASTLTVFKTARQFDTAGGTLNVPSSIVPRGRYVVELMFASFTDDDDLTTVRFENAVEPVLQGYNIDNDLSKIPATSTGSPQFEVVPQTLGIGVPTVKRYVVDVTDDNGLQIHLTERAVLNGLRILKTPAPRVQNVIVKGSTWAPGVEYSFATMVGAGMQLRPIPTQNANTIEIHFDGPVVLPANGGALRLAKTIRDLSAPIDPNKAPIPLVIQGTSATSYAYDPVNYIARWTFPATGDNSLQDGKYAILLDVDDVTGGGRKLDGDWDALNGAAAGMHVTVTPDDRLDDAPEAFVVGEGTEGAQGGYFRLNFALLAGDYNGDGVVNTAGSAADSIVAGDRWSDGDGDGIVETTSDPNQVDDLDVRGNNANDFLPLRKVHGADFDDDELIDGADLQVWRTEFSVGQGADFDGDGDSDAADFLHWQQLIGSSSAWANRLSEFAGTAASVFGAPGTVIGDFAPRVLNVIVSGSLSTHAPFSLDTVDGSGAQISTVPVGGADTISIVFSEDVNVSDRDLIVIGMTTFNLPELADFSYDATTYTASWRFKGWALADNYLLALSDGITDVQGNWLDGEWTNPASVTTVNAAISEFPSGDGTPGGWFKFAMTLLPGDANLDGVVNGTDYGILAANYGSAMNEQFAEGDFDGDGAVDADDYNLLASTFSRNLTTLKLQADFDGDLDVDDFDLDLIADNAGMTGATWADGDLDGDGEVTLDDLDLALAQYGLGLEVVS